MLNHLNSKKGGVGAFFVRRIEIEGEVFMNINQFDTIAAISTPPGEGAIGIIRLSGEDAIAIANSVYESGFKNLKKVSSHTIHYGHIVNPKTEEMIDEVMVTVMRAPKTFTREDVVEINCHGGVVSVNRLLQTVLQNGARMAEPGEFTKRAFLNGRIDLSQAEAVMDLIRAKTDKAMDVALRQLDGDLSQLIRNIRQIILDTLAEVEVNIDYPEYDDVEEVTTRLLKEKTTEVKQHVEELLRTAEKGKILRDGLETAIIGRPNVGKSSLLNRLIRQEKAIVTEIAGTTRDTIEEYVNVNGVPLKLVDTAGIRETEDIVERIGVERSRKALLDADLILLLINQSEPLNEEDKQLLDATQMMKRIILLNKSDLETRVTLEELAEWSSKDKIIQTSMLTQTGLDQLEKQIAEMFFSGETGERDATYISNARHIALLHETMEALDEVLIGIDRDMPVDLVQIDFTHAWELLGEITGDTVQDELLTQLFSQFCLGK